MNSTIPARPFITHMTLRNELAEALAAKQQAEDAQAVAETERDNQKRRAFRAETESDSYAQCMRELFAEYVIEPRADDLDTDTLIRVADRLYSDWSDGVRFDDIDVQAHINDEVGA